MKSEPDDQLRSAPWKSAVERALEQSPKITDPEFYRAKSSW